MPRRIRWRWVAIVVTSILLFLVALIFFVDDDSYEEVEVSFLHNNNHLVGSMILPKNKTEPLSVMVFVHGDGAMPYDAYGYYRPLWNRLAEQGIASFSWNKAGVGNSTGNWEAQSLDDRADEVIVAIEMLKQRKDISFSKIGLIGYSQAGWVLPLVSTKSSYPDFMVLISGAINWMKQGDYLTENRLIREGFSQEQIEAALEYNRNSIQILSPTSTYDDYIQFHNANYPKVLKENSEPMAPNRFEFAKLNWQYDARDNLKDIRCPTLAIFGDKDQNVDFSESTRVYQEEFNKSGNKDLTIKLFPNAQHALLKNNYFGEVLPGAWFLIKLELLGADAFVDGYFNFLVNWVEDKANTL